MPNAADFNKKSWSKIFFILAFLFGTILVFTIPPLSAPDEPAHFSRAYLLAQGQLSPDIVNGNPVGTCSEDLQKFISSWPEAAFDAKAKVSVNNFTDEIKAASAAPGNSLTATCKYWVPNTSPIVYIPQAAGIVIGRIFFAIFRFSGNYNIINQLYCARLFNLLYYIIMIYLAIKITPVFKRTLVILALMPTAVFIAASCSYDVFLYTSCFLFTAEIFNCAYNKEKAEIRNKDIVLLSVTAAFVFISKYAYFPLLFLLLLLPKSKFKNTKQKIIKIAAVCASAVIFTLLWSVIYKFTISGITPDTAVLAQQKQLSFLISHPLRFAAVMWCDLAGKKFYLSTFVSGIGWLDIYIPTVLQILYLLFFICSALLEKVEFRLRMANRLLVFLISASCVAIVEAAMYVYFTANMSGVYGNQIIGVQGRYFIPFAFAGAFFAANRLSSKFKFAGKFDIAMSEITAPVLVITFVCTSFFTFLRYWIH